MVIVKIIMGNHLRRAHGLSSSEPVEYKICIMQNRLQAEVGNCFNGQSMLRVIRYAIKETH